MNTKHEALRQQWARWRAIQDRVIAHPRYCAQSWNNGHARTIRLLISLAQFAAQEMAHSNTAYWNGQTARLP